MSELAMRAGELVAISTGEYSDYGYQGVFVALQNVSAADFKGLAKSIRDNSNQEENYVDLQSLFIASCIRSGWLLCVDVNEIHIGSYGELSV